jgi:hypothetical protein
MWGVFKLRIPVLTPLSVGNANVLIFTPRVNSSIYEKTPTAVGVFY